MKDTAAKAMMKVFCEGYDAANKGKTEEANPYATGSLSSPEKHQRWLMGWVVATLDYAVTKRQNNLP